MDQQSVAEQLHALRLENDLLTGELLRLRLAGVRAAPGTPIPSVAESSGAAANTSVASSAGGPTPEAYEQVVADMRWLLARLSNSPFGFVLRRRQGFRALVERYGDEGRLP